MTSKLERIILTSFSVFFCWFFLSTLHLFQHVSSTLDLKNTKSSFELALNSLVLHHEHPRNSNNRHRKVVDQIYFESDAELNSAVKKIPFPQSIKNEKMESITHPALEMMAFVKAMNNHNNTSNVKGDEKTIDGEEEKTIEMKNQTLMVPIFWNPPSLFKDGVRSFLGNYGERLITPEEAKVIGSYTKPADNSNNDQEEQDDDEEDEEDASKNKKRDENVLLETIFVSIASYRDYRCPHTLRQLFLQATYPERIRVAIVDQLKPGEDTNCAQPNQPCTENPNGMLCKYSHLIDIYEMDASMAVGPVLARHIGGRMYRGEYFAMQTDAHMEFVQGWDVDIIRQWKSANNEMAVLTTYVSDVDDHYNKTTGERTVNSRPKMCVTDFDPDYYDNRLTNLMHGQQPEGKPDVIGEPTLHPFWAAGFSFSRGHFLIQVPYDQYLPMIFQGEEINIGLRGFTYGYDYYAPERSVVFHYYSHGGKEKKVKTFWENSDAYNGLEQASMARLLGITELLVTEKDVKEYEEILKEKGGKNSDVKESSKEEQVEEIEWNLIEEKKYGLGQVRTVKKFLQTFGINIVTKTVQAHLCRFVGKPMNDMFLRHIRHDRMGVNYDRISFVFKDSTKKL
jgi:[Skp1-protein]-hydroxyproline N-acetylglucosaminyltransferase